ncbi:hypothetical protein MHU86_1707 [Fragilaria crotonensis]|nr:hypothetical protein MHU86_1707 [Fragilaria crotonensis]
MNTVPDNEGCTQSFKNGMPDIPPTARAKATPEIPSTNSSTLEPVPVPQLPRTDFNPDGPYEFDAEILLPRRASLHVIKFAAMPTLQLLTSFDSDDECEPPRFVRPEQELQERPAQTHYAVDNDSDVESSPAERVRKRAKTVGWGANMFPINEWKCDTCYVHNALNLMTCLSCAAVRPGCGAKTASNTPVPVHTSACTDPYSFGVETFVPQGANRPVIEFAPMQTLQKLTTVVTGDDEDDEGKQIRFVRPEQELQERPEKTLHTVNNDSEVESTPTDHAWKSTKSEGWGANMFPINKWKCDSCYVQNALSLMTCLSCGAVPT